MNSKLLASFAILALSVSCGRSSDSSDSQPTIPNVPKDLPPVDELSAGSSFNPESTKLGCYVFDISELEIPRDHANPEAGSMPYKFQLIGNQDSEKETIIHVPGGPGQNLIGSDRNNYLSLGDFNHILIDPRGVGCNAGDIENELLTTEQHTKDLIQVVDQLGLSNYVIYGISYGTVVATQFSDIANELGEDFNQPKAIVMEGVVGAPARGDEYNQSFSQRWEETKDLIPGLERAFSQNQDLPFGYSVGEWNSIISALLTVGGPEGRSWLEAASLENRVTAEGREQIKDLFEDILADGITIEGQQGFYREVGCRELFDETRYFNYIYQGSFQVYDLNEFLSNGIALTDAVQVCNSVELDRPFNPSDYVMADVPTYYFQGTMDPNTPYEKALLHKEAQEQNLSKQFFVVIEDAGHNPLSIQLSDCEKQIWQRIFEGRDLESGFLLNSSGYCFSSGISNMQSSSSMKVFKKEFGEFELTPLEDIVRTLERKPSFIR